MSNMTAFTTIQGWDQRSRRVIQAACCVVAQSREASDIVHEARSLEGAEVVRPPFRSGKSRPASGRDILAGMITKKTLTPNT